MKLIWKTIIWLTAFSIAMGYLEAAIVVYLRMFYYPEGFNFPLKVIDHRTAITEFWREFATLIMLYGVGRLAGKNSSQRFAFFIYNFAVWDLFYYIFLKVILNWPESLFTWDILFLIPVPWVGPVLAPCILSVTMIFFAGIIIYFNDKGLEGRLKGIERLLLISGCIIVICACIQDYIANLYSHGELNSMFNILNPHNQAQLFPDFASYIPSSFSWLIFGIGELVILVATGMYFARNKRSLAQRGQGSKILNLN